MLPDDKVIITVAVNGGMQQDRDGCVVPKQAAEIGEAAARACEAGAAMVHVHTRDANGKNSGDKAMYAETIREIRARSPILNERRLSGSALGQLNGRNRGAKLSKHRLTAKRICRIDPA